MRHRALLQGRFQPVSVGHAAVLAEILQRWRYVTIGVVYNSPRPNYVDPRLVEYLNQADQGSYGPYRNPFTPEEIKRMWEAYIEQEGLDGRVTCRLVKRLEFYENLEEVFPASEIDFVWPEITSNDTVLDVMRHKLYPDIFKRDILYVRPVLKLHNAQIRNLIRAGSSWQNFIPPGAHEIFCSVDGAARMENAMREYKPK